MYRSEGVWAKTVVLKFECVLDSPRGLVEGRISKPHLQNSDSVGLGAALEFVFLLSSQARLMLSALQPKHENDQHRHSQSALQLLASLVMQQRKKSEEGLHTSAFEQGF